MKQQLSKMKAAQRYAFEIKITQLQVCALLEKTNVWYRRKQEHTGYDFLRLILKNDIVLFEQISSSIFFWKFWQTQWVIRDKQYLAANAISGIAIGEDGSLKNYYAGSPNANYNSYHDVDVLLYDYENKKSTLYNAYDSMMTEIIKNAIKNADNRN
jgi:hypothetical protein